VAFLVDPTSPTTNSDITTMQAAARTVGQEIVVLRASTASEIDSAFATLIERRAGGLLVNGNAFFSTRNVQLVTLAARHAIPTVYFNKGFTAAGGLISYSDDRDDSYLQAGVYVGRILKGEKALNLPVLQPTKFEFVINLKTAKTLGIEFPP